MPKLFSIKDELIMLAEKITIPKYKPKKSPEYFHDPFLAQKVNEYKSTF